MTKHVPLAERQQPGLVDTLPAAVAPNQCRSCGVTHTSDNPLSRWLECDEWDKLPKKPRAIVICERCRPHVVEAHPRLYVELAAGAAWPGTMGVCMTCRLRDGVTCTSERSVLNDGGGLHFQWSDPPFQAFMCGSFRGQRRSGLSTVYAGPVIACDGHEPREIDAAGDGQIGE